jgi:hypothetical protein
MMRRGAATRRTPRGFLRQLWITAATCPAAPSGTTTRHRCSLLRPVPWPCGAADGAHACAQVAHCLSVIAEQTPEQLYERFGIPRNRPGFLFDGLRAGMAERLHHQAVIMRDYGTPAAS